MSRWDYYTESACADNPEHPENTWKSLGELARRLAEKAGGAA